MDILKKKNTFLFMIAIFSGLMLLLLIFYSKTTDKEIAERLTIDAYQILEKHMYNNSKQQNEELNSSVAPEVEKEYQRGNKHIIIIKATLLLAQGMNEKSYRVYIDALNNASVISNRKITRIILLSLHNYIHMYKNYKDRTIKFYEEFYKKNKVLYGDIIAIFLYQAYYCKDNKKRNMWRNIVSTNKNGREIVSVYEQKMKCN
ncbi:MAG: hypothetical protein FE834_07190 [Gammaproteobacteria bacterium]|nr:hypothetical protein [Gammaproteobacteria bacterium]